MVAKYTNSASLNLVKLQMGQDLLNQYLGKMSPETLAAIDQPIRLLAASSPAVDGQYQAVECPRRIRLMCRLIDDLLQSDESQTEIKLFLTYPCLRFMIDYCRIFDYLKVMSFIEFPLLHNCFGSNCMDEELELLFRVRNDLDFLQQVMICSKYLRCETIY